LSQSSSVDTRIVTYGGESLLLGTISEGVDEGIWDSGETESTTENSGIIGDIVDCCVR
jgi:hypothetical protein